jgi:phosphotransferase system HPr-like phosphotransfer protein
MFCEPLAVELERKALLEEETRNDLLEEYLNELDWMSAEDDCSPHTKNELIEYLESLVVEKEFVLKWRLGARASAALWQCAKQFTSSVVIKYKGVDADAKNLMDLLLLNQKNRLRAAKSKKEKERIANEAEAVLKKDGNTTSLDIQPGATIKLVISGRDSENAMESMTKVLGDLSYQ